MKVRICKWDRKGMREKVDQRKQKYGRTEVREYF
jgi:hypothetical protein